MHTHTLIHRHIYTHTYKHNYKLTHTYIHLNSYKHAYIHAHSQTNKQLCTITNTFFTTYAQIHADNTYVHVKEYIYIPVHAYRYIQIHSFIHEHKKKIFDENILKRKIFKQKYFHSKKIVQIDIKSHINTHTNSWKNTFYRHTRVDQIILKYVI